MTQLNPVSTPPVQAQPKSLIAKMAERFQVDPAKFMTTIKATAFKQRDGSAPTDEQMMALMVVADQYTLNPFTKEIYAFPDRQNGIIPVVGVDGWSRIINSHPQFDGLEFRQSENMVQMPSAKVSAPEWMEAIIYRKDRNNPVVVREYLDEVYRAPFKPSMTGPWQTHTKRFLRHKTLIQCARIALGYTGIYDQDEAERILDAQVVSDQDGAGNAVNTNSNGDIGEIKKYEITKLVETLAARAASQGAWAAATEYLEGRYSGAELAYAKQCLSEAEIKSLDASVALNAPVEATPVEAVNAEASPPVEGEQPPMAEPDGSQPHATQDNFDI